MHKLLVVKDVALGGKEQFKDSVLSGLQLVPVCIDANYQLVPLLFQIRTLQTDYITRHMQKNVVSL